ncbi:hypothetical protein GJ496_004591 [Pomphorhynchus laevis]|nr:hypothetical protein GJ496_004591 [Pomphorhynchus laevis]
MHIRRKNNLRHEALTSPVKTAKEVLSEYESIVPANLQPIPQEGVETKLQLALFSESDFIENLKSGILDKQFYELKSLLDSSKTEVPYLF